MTEVPGRRLTISVEEAADCLGVSRSYAYLLARTNSLPGVLKIGSRYRVSLALLHRFLGIGNGSQPNGGQDADW